MKTCRLVVKSADRATDLDTVQQGDFHGTHGPPGSNPHWGRRSDGASRFLHGYSVEEGSMGTPDGRDDPNPAQTGLSVFPADDGRGSGLRVGDVDSRLKTESGGVGDGSRDASNGDRVDRPARRGL